MKKLIIFILFLSFSKCLVSQDTIANSGELIISESFCDELIKNTSEENKLLKQQNMAYYKAIMNEDYKNTELLMLLYALLDADSEEKYNLVLKMIPDVLMRQGIEDSKVIKNVVESEENFDKFYKKLKKI